MKLVRIRNKYMYKPTTEFEKQKYKPEGSHLYLVYKDKLTGETRAIQLTHIYENKKVARIEKGELMVTKFPTVKYPSGVRNDYITTDVDGNPLDLKAVKALNVSNEKAVYITGKKAEEIKKFAYRKRK